MIENKRDHHIETLKIIFSTLDNLKYECASRQYTLDDEEMGNIFFCRDLAELAIKDEEK